MSAAVHGIMESTYAVLFRSFITTDVNPYYDSFVRWQFIKLKYDLMLCRMAALHYSP